MNEEATGLLQRALNALNRGGADHELLAVDRRLGHRTLTALADFLAVRGAAGQARLLKAIAALRGTR